MPVGARNAGEFVEGKGATARALTTRLPGARVEFLHGALLNPLLGEDQIEQILGRPSLPSALIQQIAAQMRWLVRYEVKRAIVAHADAPLPLKLNLVHFLRWKDLARITAERRTVPPLKRAAETLLRCRIEQMALGERIALAHVASPGVIPALLGDPSPEVLSALLRNGKVTEENVLALISGERTSAAALSAVGSCARWASRPTVMMALVRNARTPTSVTLRFLGSLSGKDLSEVLASPQAPRLVKATVRQILRAAKETPRCKVH